MKEKDGTTTSSPSPTPATTSARCNAVVQLEVATAWPTCWCSAKACSKACVRGPWATQPEAMTSATASLSAVPSHGFITLILLMFRLPSIRWFVSGGGGFALQRPSGGDLLAQGSPPLDEPEQAVLQADGRTEAEVSGCGLRVGQPPHHRVHRALRAVLDALVRTHDAQQRLGQLAQAGFLSTGNVVDAIGDRAGSRQQVGPGDVFGEDEVHGLAPVAEDQRRQTVVDAFHPAHEHLGVGAMDIHPGSIDVEVAQHHVVQPVHRTEALKHPLVECLGGTVQRVVVVRVVMFR